MQAVLPSHAGDVEASEGAGMAEGLKARLQQERSGSHMELTRRGFIEAAGLAVAGSMAFELSIQSKAFALDAHESWKLVDTKETTSICCFCSGGCGLIASVRDGVLINAEGDPDHPVSEGGLCPKGAAMMQLVEVVDEKTGELIPNPYRVYKPLVRRAGKAEWEDITWDDALDEIAAHTRKTRDAFFTEVDENGLTVNRTTGIASLGGSQLHTEEDYLILKMMRALGVVAIDNQARV